MLAMKYNCYKTILVLIVITSITSCGSRDKRKEIKELTNSEIENILSICHEDTIMVLGHFIQFDFDNVVSQPVGQYYYVAELLGRPFESTSDIDSMRNVVHELYIKTRGTGISMIAIPPTFVPKVEITDKLKQLSLRDLILNDINTKNIREKYQDEKSSMFEWYQSLYKRKDKSKYVSCQSNLAKVFFIQEKDVFIELNKFYYYKIRYDFMHEQIKQQELSEEQAAQSKWDEYLR